MCKLRGKNGKVINELDGVKEATVNFMTTKLVIDGEDEKMPTIIAEAEKIVKKNRTRYNYEKGLKEAI